MSTTSHKSNINQANDVTSSAYATALLRSLHFSGVKFLRYCTVDVCNNIRCKAKPVDQLLSQHGRVTLNDQVSIPEVCYAGLPYYADAMIEGTGLTAKKVLILQPDLHSFRILPYAPKSAIVMGNSIDQFTDESSPLCTRSLLSKVVRDAREQHNIAFVTGCFSILQCQIIMEYCTFFAFHQLVIAYSCLHCFVFVSTFVGWDPCCCYCCCCVLLVSKQNTNDAEIAAAAAVADPRSRWASNSNSVCSMPKQGALSMIRSMSIRSR